MGKKDSDYQVVYRGEALPRYVPGGLAFFQRPKESGCGYWIDQTLEDYFMFGIGWLVSLNEGRSSNGRGLVR
ncbi:ABC transporter ATP-binding protein [Cronobacter dublinensis]|nr:ABC transporter ATP-binding protein [Cronobacter dublinensis]